MSSPDGWTLIFGLGLFGFVGGFFAIWILLDRLVEAMGRWRRSVERPRQGGE